jgi:hypothetical protein
MDLKEVADIMKAGVEPISIDPSTVKQKLDAGGPQNRQDITYKGQQLRLQFTLDVLPTMKKMWHLSVGVLDGSPLVDDTVTEIVSHFMANPMEMPSVVHNRRHVRHFIELYQEQAF